MEEVETKAGEQPAKAKKAKKEKAPAAPKDRRNGVTKPAAGTATGKVWEIADFISNQKQAPASRKEVVEAAEKAGLNPSTVLTQYGRWRRYYGLEGNAAPVGRPKGSKSTKAAEEEVAAE